MSISISIRRPPLARWRAPMPNLGRPHFHGPIFMPPTIHPTLEIGESVATLETRVAQLLSKNHGVMVNSGSSSLRLAIDLLRLQPGDEIITSPMTFSTDIAPMVQSGIVPVFVDIEPNTYQIDATQIVDMIGPNTKAILTS